MNCNTPPKCDKPCGDCTQEWPRPAAAQAPAEAHGNVLVPLAVLEDASSAIGNFVSDYGWGDSDMQAMDNLDAYIARHKANVAANVQPKGTAAFNGWYCAHCQRGVDSSEVTYHEQHTVCGRVITDDVPPAQAPAPAPGPVAYRYWDSKWHDWTYTTEQAAPEGRTLEPLYAAPCAAVGADKLWLWKNFVDGRPEYWAFDNPFPVHMDGGDPQTLGEPCGYALFKPSRVGRTDVPEAEVIRRIKAAKPAGDEVLEALRKLDKAAMDVVWAQNQHDARVAVHWLSEAAKQSHAVIAKADADSHVPVQHTQRATGLVDCGECLNGCPAGKCRASSKGAQP